ncbi:gamma-aminobutyric acid receptor subunit pi-like isoform X2 [Petromyzon marinus]|uniref:Gamma-aminobutyric acid receptor subunit pi-like isoform X3 n=1 Tax=Petromyzon marinus TaxID=7757 RepID=A0AAJ7WRZ1_PETMA|nr:gamma-aminobutyric acid receptor subunit pi-like isoform X3 [Petromyzon marinus]
MLLLYYSLLLQLIKCSQGSQEYKEGDALPQKIQNLMRGYNKYLRPSFDNGPVAIGMSLDIASIDTISEINMDYTATIFLRQRWQDERLCFEGNKSLSLDGRLVELLWVPDTFIVDSKRSFLHDITVENRLIRIFPNGTVLYALRITTTVACNMDLTKYPMDKQTCTLQLESCQYPKLVFHFKLRRNILYFILETYIPSVLLVVLSWVSFWISQSSVPARICIGVTTVLTMTTLMMGARTSLPNANCFIKAIDVYLGICFSFIFGALVEYAVAHFHTLEQGHIHDIQRELKKEFEESNGMVQTPVTRCPAKTADSYDGGSGSGNGHGHSSSPGHGHSSSPGEPKPNGAPQGINVEGKKLKKRLVCIMNCCTVQNPHHIDIYSRKAFPLTFIVINLCYWIYYLYL